MVVGNGDGVIGESKDEWETSSKWAYIFDRLATGDGGSARDVLSSRCETPSFDGTAREFKELFKSVCEVLGRSAPPVALFTEESVFRCVSLEVETKDTSFMGGWCGIVFECE